MPDLRGSDPPAQRGRGPGAEAADLHHVRLAGAERGLSAGAHRPHRGGRRGGGDGGERGLRLRPAVLLLVHLYLLLRAPAQKAAAHPGRRQLPGAALGVLQLERPVLPAVRMAVHRRRLPLCEHLLRPLIQPVHAHPHRDPLHPLHPHPGAGGPPALGPADQPPVQDHPGHLHPARHRSGRLCAQGVQRL